VSYNRYNNTILRSLNRPANFYRYTIKPENIDVISKCMSQDSKSFEELLRDSTRRSEIKILLDEQLSNIKKETKRSLFFFVVVTILGVLFLKLPSMIGIEPKIIGLMNLVSIICFIISVFQLLRGFNSTFSHSVIENQLRTLQLADYIDEKIQK
jgi:hypothetical protein